MHPHEGGERSRGASSLSVGADGGGYTSSCTNKAVISLAVKDAGASEQGAPPPAPLFNVGPRGPRD